MNLHIVWVKFKPKMHNNTPMWILFSGLCQTKFRENINCFLLQLRWSKTQSLILNCLQRSHCRSFEKFLTIALVFNYVLKVTNPKAANQCKRERMRDNARYFCHRSKDSISLGMLEEHRIYELCQYYVDFKARIGMNRVDRPRPQLTDVSLFF